MTRYRPLFELTSISAELHELYRQDQEMRNKYSDYLRRYPNWVDAAEEFANDHGTSKSDIFSDKPRQEKAKRLIKDNIKEITQDGKLLDLAWLLVQHMDNDLSFQKWFLAYLPEGSENYKYLSDRVLRGEGKKQRFGTQNF